LITESVSGSVKLSKGTKLQLCLNKNIYFDVQEGKGTACVILVTASNENILT
jgi:hypothetical protein